MPKEEKDLLRKSAGGDAESFGEIIRRYRYLVYAAALQIVKDPRPPRTSRRRPSSPCSRR